MVEKQCLNREKGFGRKMSLPISNSILKILVPHENKR
jgi:hypothetical protein